ncbi:hypothetical protein K505DRAFT_324957 [Melanomma pulvis-pyrius CBS 109.77]|uniref:Ubiquitin 3 binding protein But2 C-terminal domain-containing protein n=1 Tax=Melanomma pulvis-pyrius CBS 109.77 TaxID=1314802 RepID=A0A6A6XCC0_9PLEO|nr:hypothetical protein K505DRAFT_324957 [Melanomma pulvis-pyrius CBS 109.77]
MCPLFFLVLASLLGLSLATPSDQAGFLSKDPSPPLNPYNFLIPTNAPLAGANSFQIRIVHKISGSKYSLEWTLLDSNSTTIQGPSTSPTIPGSNEDGARSAIQIDVERPISRDESRIQFTMKTDAFGGCTPTWNMGRSTSGETSFVAACQPGLQDNARGYGCEDNKKVQWKILDNVFERAFICWGMNLEQSTVSLN